MHRRARHLNPLHAGAVSALDARFLEGLNDGDGITTFTSRTGTNSPTQSTAGNKPIYSINQQAGCPAALFNDSASTGRGRFATWSTSPISGASEASFVYAFKRTALSPGQGSLVSNFGNYFNNDHDPFTGTASYVGLAATTRHAWTSVAQDVVTIQTIISKSGEYTVRRLGNSVFTTATNTVGIGLYPRIGGNNALTPNGQATAAYYWNGQMYCLSIFNSALSSPLRRRIEHAVGFSYKIQTN